MTVRIVYDPEVFVTLDLGCQYCGDPAKPPAVAVYGTPMPDVITVVDSQGILVCTDCMYKAAWLALLESDESRAVRVVPIKAVAA
jgi:hypothetical protein